MRALVIGPAEKAVVAQVVAHAEANRIDLRRLWRMVQKKEPCVGDLPGFACALPVGFRCVFSIEQQPGGWMRHLSVSVTGAGKYPHEAAIAALGFAFGFRHAYREKQWTIYTEPEYEAVNVLEKLED